jgi:hypothetical protein
MEIKVGLSKYTSILIDDWSTEDDDKNNIGHQLLKFVKESLGNIKVSEIKLVFVGDDRHTMRDGIVATFMVFTDNTAALMVSIVIRDDKDMIKVVANQIIEKIYSWKDIEDGENT